MSAQRPADESAIVPAARAAAGSGAAVGSAALGSGTAAGARVVDVLVAEIGSTTTVVSAFEGLSEESRKARVTPTLLGQGVAPTSVLQGDVTVGMNAARAQLEESTGPLQPREFLATSSAAGGLRMTVHGLTAKMTAMAAREAALGAGGVVEYQTAGKLRRHDLQQIAAARPNVIMLAGGVEGGDVETVLHNAEMLAQVDFSAAPAAPGEAAEAAAAAAALDTEASARVSLANHAGHAPIQDRVLAAGKKPMIIYAGNSAVRDECCEILQAAGFTVRVTTNVYPGIDELDIVPARTVIHDAFEAHIIHAPGMERIGELVTGTILPTPGAVLLAAETLAETLGDLVVIDVGGATTDVHSVTDGSIEYNTIQTEPQPHSKRTVEGDLGTFVSAEHVNELIDARERPEHLPPAIPQTDEDRHIAVQLARTATVTGVYRHAGQIAYLYTPTGRQTVARGRDLTACRHVIGTGGALTRLPGGLEALRDACAKNGGDRLLPPSDADVALDGDYIFAVCGALLAHFDAQAVVQLMLHSIGATPSSC